MILYYSNYLVRHRKKSPYFNYTVLHNTTVHDNVLVVSIETRSTSCSTNFYSLFTYLCTIQRQIH